MDTEDPPFTLPSQGPVSWTGESVWTQTHSDLPNVSSLGQGKRFVSLQRPDGRTSVQHYWSGTSPLRPRLASTGRADLCPYADAELSFRRPEHRSSLGHAPCMSTLKGSPLGRTRVLSEVGTRKSKSFPGADWETLPKHSHQPKHTRLTHTQK